MIKANNDKDTPRNFNAWSRKNGKEHLTHDENLALIEEYKKYGDINVRNEIVERNMALIKFWVYHYGKKYEKIDTQVYPLFEDLLQDGILHCIHAIEKFNLDYQFSFATYLTKILKRRFDRRVYLNSMQKRKGKTVSLDAPIKNSHEFAEGDENSLIDFIPDKNSDMNKIDDKLDYMLVVEEILSILPKKEREMFYDHYYHKKTLDQIGKKYDYTRERVRQILEETQEKVQRLYLEGVKEKDILFKGVNFKQSQRDRLFAKNGVIKKYGRDFLENYFLPKLPRKQAIIFKESFLNEYGQTVEEIGKQLGYNGASIVHIEKDIIQKLQEMSPKLLEAYEKKKSIPMNKNQLKAQQEINRTQRFIDEHGGKYFLGKYFMPLLGEQEKQYFNLRYLNYNGLKEKEIQAILKVSQSGCAMLKTKVLAKLENTDFETIVDFIDNAEHFKIELDHIQPNQAKKIKERKEFVKKNGGVVKLKEHFLPLLPDFQAMVFENLYLYPRYSGTLEMATSLKISSANIINAEKIVLEKLNSTNLDELERITTTAAKCVDGETKSSSKIKNRNKWLIKLGGEEFLREVVLPTIKVPAHKIIFEKAIIEGLTTNEILNELNLKQNRKSYIQRTKNYLQVYAQKFASREKNKDVVKQFYAKKEFEKIHPEDFEKKAFGVEEKTTEKEVKVNKINKEGSVIKRKEYMETFLNKFGGIKELIKNFLPKLNKVVFQQVFLGTFIECKLDEVVMKEYNLTQIELKKAKNYLVTKLEEFANDKQKKSSKSPKRDF